MKYKKIYNLLKQNGHTPLKAVEIILDATRGNRYSRQWIMTTFKQRH